MHKFGEARQLIDAIAASTVIGLRARAPMALMVHSFGLAIVVGRGTLVAFRVGALDAKRLAGKFGMTNPATMQTNIFHP
jgi:hypothetical protein